MLNQEKTKKDIEKLQQQYESDKLQFEDNNKNIKLMDLEFKTKLDQLKFRKSVYVSNKSTCGAT